MFTSASNDCVNFVLLRVSFVNISVNGLTEVNHNNLSLERNPVHFSLKRNRTGNAP